MMTDQIDTESMPGRAADGGHVPGACNTMGEFIRTLEDGQFDADCYAAVRDLAAKMNDVARFRGKAKGKIVITLDFVQEAQVSSISSTFKVTEPAEPRVKSILFQTEDHRFSRTRPGQAQLFGIRDVSGVSDIRNV